MNGVGSVLVAGGSSTRLSVSGTTTPKQFQLLGTRPLLALAADCLLDVSDELIIVVPGSHRGFAERQLRAAGLFPGGTELTVRIVEGGARRQDSVLAGLSALSPSIEYVLIHDAARPFATRELSERVLAAAREAGAAVPVVPVPDTVKREENGEVVATLDRSVLRLTQTPQGFQRRVIEDAYSALGHTDVTDDGGVVELAGGRVVVVDGLSGNRKITCAEDMDAARLRVN
ncbi:2-C-methyl-D-erythritol 4-phosphate cytidylyltransferase, partial [bacterium]|nr:2-C-methyl-D-erythritol 4-phosphate cytidylyltransferase [bacterium]